MLNQREVLNRIDVLSQSQFPSGTVSAAQRLRGRAA
ncbi:hypothetical protein QFZ35_000389 [Arthrobacter ulcerisalmonis]|nr:hypothetical protein [Arthrobacter ulcerisalmonis]MDQ0729806.1 hypothetical protein [Arthrobacter sp. B1I2]